MAESFVGVTKTRWQGARICTDATLVTVMEGTSLGINGFDPDDLSLNDFA